MVTKRSAGPNLPPKITPALPKPSKATLVYVTETNYLCSISMKNTLLKSSLALAILIVAGQNISAQTWTAKTDFINGESLSAYAFTINDTIYVGNTGGTGFYKYDHTTDTWTPKADVPLALNNRTASVGFTVNGKGYVVGGIRSPGVCMSDVWEYNPATDSWTQKTDFPGDKRGAASCFVIGNKAYIGGGYDTIDIAGFSLIPKNDFWQYDPATDTWTPKAAIPYDSSYLLQPFSFSVGGKGYFSCGDRVKLSAGLYHDTDVNTTYEYDTTANTWTQKASFPGAVRSGGVSFVLSNIAYCGTGIDDTSVDLAGNCYNDFYSYDPIANTWAPLPLPPFAARTYAISATVSTGKAYMGTGWFSPSTSTYYQDWWEFAPAVTGLLALDHTDAHLMCYPDPNNGVFSVALTSLYNEPVQVSISNMVGDQVMKLFTASNSSTEIKLHVAPGLYLLKATTQHGSYVNRFVVE